MRKALTAIVLAATMLAPAAADAGKKICSSYVKAGQHRPGVFNGKKPHNYFRKNPAIEDAFCDAYYQLPRIDQFVNIRLGRGMRNIEVSSFMKGSTGGEDLLVWDVPEGRFMYWSDEENSTILYRKRRVIMTRDGTPLRARDFDSRDFAIGMLPSKTLEKKLAKIKHEERRVDDPFPYEAIIWIYEPEKQYVPGRYSLPPMGFPELDAISAEHSLPQSSRDGAEADGLKRKDDLLKKLEKEFEKRRKKK